MTQRREVSRADIDGLAAALLDLGSGYETALRAVLAMQRMLERVRGTDEVSPEATLLIQEMSRRCQGLVENAGSLERCLQAAGERIALLRHEPE